MAESKLNTMKGKREYIFLLNKLIFQESMKRNNLLMILLKRYYIIDQHLARHFKHNGAGLSSPPPPFYAVK